MVSSVTFTTVKGGLIKANLRVLVAGNMTSVTATEFNGQGDEANVTLLALIFPAKSRVIKKYSTLSPNTKPPNLAESISNTKFGATLEANGSINCQLILSFGKL